MRNTELPPLDEYVEIDALQPSVSTAFPSIDSLRWFVRRNRPTLVKRGAVIIVTGRMRFHPDRFKQATVEIGQRAAS
jgi:hypothetical protein